MFRGFYTAATGMLAQQRHQEALANNIANANTPGYKADQTALRAFPELLMRQMGAKNIPAKNNVSLPVQRPIGSLHTGVYVQETIPNFSQGDVRETGNATDLAIVHGDLPDETGGIFFTVQNENGEVRYTRNGNFTIDGEGYLVTNEGNYVLDANQNRIFTNGMEFAVNADGELDLGGQIIPLGLAYSANVNEMAKEGNGLYTGEAGALPAGITYRIEQGFLEQSNVNPMETMSQMMEAYRLFEMNQRVLKVYDESMEKAANEIGKLV